MHAYPRRIIDIKPEKTLPYDEGIAWLASQLKQRLDGFNCNPEARGIYLATMDSGAAASVAFWANALKHGPGFANPADFPLTLANSSAAVVSQMLEIQGPNYTLSGGSDAVYAAFSQAIHDLSASDESVQEGLVLALDVSETTRCIGMILTASDNQPSLGTIREDGVVESLAPPYTAESPTLAMSTFIQQFLNQGESYIQAGEGTIYCRKR
ncbi:MAG: hypothetical protein KZQ99_03400 [Candidatus Thiodiazotropha sp. (ex Dulcina madagascariensis)]|nr:hypothetical protein [Candidatus Thiodiazotropha sp. (ex Dulcina madagascariensis)]